MRPWLGHIFCGLVPFWSRLRWRCMCELWEPAVWLLPDKRKEMVKIAWLIP